MLDICGLHHSYRYQIRRIDPFEVFRDSSLLDDMFVPNRVEECEETVVLDEEIPPVCESECLVDPEAVVDPEAAGDAGAAVELD